MAKKKVCIIADPIDEQYAGIYTYARELISHLEKSRQGEFEYTYLHLRKNDFFKGMRELLVPLHRKFPGQASFRKFIQIPYLFRKHKFDIVHDLSHIAPFPWKWTRYKKVFTVHDLTPVTHPKLHIRNSVIVHNILFPILFRTVDHVITTSLFTKKDILKKYPFVKHISVTYQAAKKLLQSGEKKEKSPYILYVSTIEPRKNVEVLVKAYEKVREKGVMHKLVLIGKKGWKCDGVFDAIKKSPYKNDIDWKNFVTDAELGNYYANAECFVYPSEYEGFGLPILEAMNMGTPVIAADNSSIPEVVGGGGLLFKTKDIEDLTEKLYSLLSSTELKKKLTVKGKEQAKKFTWEKTAEETIDVYRKVLNEKKK